jgi:hypothetical protein
MFTGEAFIAPPPSPLAYAVSSTKGEPVEDPATVRADPTLLLGGPLKLTPAWMTQLTWMAAGALVLFLAIGGQQLYDRLSGNEAARALNAGKAADKPVKLTPREFYVLDRDRSGYLTPDEVKGDAVLEQNFKKIDKNNDGRVSLEEFTSFP